MVWQKLGRVFVAEGHHDWMRTHAAWPRAMHLREDVFRVFFSARNVRGRSHIAFVDVDVNHPTEILSISAEPVLSPGAVGDFDESGVIPCGIVRLGNGLALYYGGLSTASGEPYECFPGLAYFDRDARVATRAFTTPLLERTDAEPFSGGAVCVCRDAVTDTFHMWYESSLAPALHTGDSIPRFVIKHAISRDGVRWDRRDEVSIGDPLGRPYVSNPAVVIEENSFRMWYSYKTSDRYRIGYAESRDGSTWTRHDDHVGITPSPGGWDSEDVEYPCVFHHGSDLYMLYNGNQYGKTGFGLARLARD